MDFKAHPDISDKYVLQVDDIFEFSRLARLSATPYTLGRLILSNKISKAVERPGYPVELTLSRFQAIRVANLIVKQASVRPYDIAESNNQVTLEMAEVADRFLDSIGQ